MDWLGFRMLIHRLVALPHQARSQVRFSHFSRVPPLIHNPMQEYQDGPVRWGRLALGGRPLQLCDQLIQAGRVRQERGPDGRGLRS